jgi:hypothetical protein
MDPRRSAAVTATALAAFAGVGLAVAGPPGRDRHGTSERVGAAPSAQSVGGRSGDASRRPLASVATPTTSRRLPVLCALPPGNQKLHPGTRRGLAHHLYQYPALSLATAPQRGAARRLVATLLQTTSTWRDPRRAAERAM